MFAGEVKRICPRPEQMNWQEGFDFFSKDFQAFKAKMGIFMRILRKAPAAGGIEGSG